MRTMWWMLACLPLATGQDSSLDGSGMIVRKKSRKGPCQIDTWKTHDVILCYNSTHLDNQVTVPFSVMKGEYNDWRGTPGDWNGYDFYLDSTSWWDTGSSWWGNVFATTSKNWKRNSYGWISRANNWAKVIQGFTVNGRQKTFSFRLNSTTHPFWLPPGRWE